MPDFKALKLSDLELDRKNPRLPSRLEGADEIEIMQYLIRRTSITELVTSIGENDFFPGEAIVVTPSEENEGKYTVLEGNRRLTALKLIQDPALGKGISSSAVEAAIQANNRPSTIPTYEVEKRGDALQYLGFRHVSGVQRWDPLAKARYLKILFDLAEGSPESRYGQVASEIGSRRDTVQKNLDALAAYDLTASKQFFDIPDLNEEKFQFGVFYTALANPRIATFAGARDEGGEPRHPVVNPGSLKVDQVQELVEWIFEKDENGDTKLGESRNIPMLAAAISSSKGLELLRKGASLEDAYNETPDIQNEFIREMKIALTHLKQANTKLAVVEVSESEVLRIVGEVQKEIRTTREFLGLP